MTLISLLWAAPAFAGSCDTLLSKIDGLNVSSVDAAFADLIKCDRKLAESNFNRYLAKATEPDALVGLAMLAVDNDIWNPLWTSIGKITDYSIRDEVTRQVGASCAEHPKVVNFLEGAYFGLRALDFQQWDDAFGECQDTNLWIWMDGKVKEAPKSSFDEKYDALMGIYIHTRKVDALPSLTEAAITSATDGPFDSIISRMVASVAPDLGGSVSPENQSKLVAALVDVAKKVPAAQAHSVADQLANSGAEGAAASLLPSLYADRMQAGGSFIYGAASIEAGDCDGKKTAILHYTTVTEPGKRWTILGDIEAPMRAFKPKLKGCTVEEPWAVIHSPEPLKSASDVEKWLETAQAEWLESHKDYKVDTQKEKGVSL